MNKTTMPTREEVLKLRSRIERAWHNHDDRGRVTISMGDAMMLVEQVLLVAGADAMDDCVVVPKEPTDEMLEAGRDAGASAYADADGIRMEEAWAAMLAAAQGQDHE